MNDKLKILEEAMAEDQEAADSASQDVPQDLREELKAELLKELRTELRPAQAVPDGEWVRDYAKEAHLRVMGGVEVRHPKGFRPRPPSGLPMYHSTEGAYTDSVDPVFRTHYRSDANGNPVVDDQGRPQGTQVMVTPGAKKDENGKPILTEEYKQWLFVRLRGDRLDSTVMSDIRSGKGIPQGAVVDGDPIQTDDEGVPYTVAE